MKATGIVRRIDDLGRVVIPKEIRRTMRIREGDPLEIYTDNDGEVIFKKYSPIGEMSDFASSIAESISNSISMPVVVFDRDHCIAAAGIAKKEVLERRISSQAEELLENRMRFSKGEGDKNSVYPLEGVDKASCVFSPVIVNGDIIGGITVLESDSNETHSPSVEKVCELAAEFLTKQMEE